ncbi:MAG: DNA polymerase I [Porphyromonadaceae bacterium]|nr:DNA polymerase I [Porphyromonadaceae bacterium]
MSRKRIFFLDAYALIFRAYYAFIRSPRIDSQGRNTSAIFGFALMLDEILDKEQPDLIAVAFDPPGGTFRHEAYEAYKAQRDETPEGIRLAVPYIKRLLEAYRIPILEVAGYEADDVIGTLAVQAEQAGLEVLMVTPDKDYGQLVSPHISMYRPMSGGGYEVWGEQQIVEKFGLSQTKQVIDYLGLVGDSADNLPGCPRIGEKTAQKLLAEFGSIEGIYEHIDQVKGKTREYLEVGKESTLMTRELATIHTGVPIAWQESQFVRKPLDAEALRELYTELEFRSLLNKLSTRVEESAPDPAEEVTDDSMGDLFAFDYRESSTSTPSESTQALDLDIQHLTTVAQVEAMAERAMQLGYIAFDTETTGLDPLEAELVAASFAFGERETYFLLFPEDRAETLALLEPLRRVFASDRVLKIGQNIKYDLQILLSYDIEISLPLFDTMVAHYLLFPDMRHGLDELSERYLGLQPMSFEEMIKPQNPKKPDLRAIELDRLAYYAAEDAALTYRLYRYFEPMLAEREQTALMNELEMPLIPVLASMEREGVRIDRSVLAEKSAELHTKLTAVEQEIFELAGRAFNVNSAKQVGELLFDELKIVDKPKKTKTGGYTTSEEVLEKLRNRHPIVERILDYRGLKKLLSTYVDALPDLVYPDGKLHSSFNQTVAATGRLSSSNPNIQNIPIRTAEGRAIRAAFVPNDADSVFLSADYSQIELRLMAHMSADEGLIEAFRQGHDIHQATAAKIHGIPLEEVTSEQRRGAKTANFGIIYGISAFGLAERLSIPRGEAKALIDGYFASYPGVKAYMDRVVEQAKGQGYVCTLLGRRRYLPDITSANAVVRGYAERNAINAPLQGTAADIIKIAMIRLYAEIRRRSLKSRMILQVHDELNFNVPKSELAEMRQLVRETMQSALTTLAVPLVVEVGEGESWLEAH